MGSRHVAVQFCDGCVNHSHALSVLFLTAVSEVLREVFAGGQVSSEEVD